MKEWLLRNLPIPRQCHWCACWFAKPRCKDATGLPATHVCSEECMTKLVGAMLTVMRVNFKFTPHISKEYDAEFGNKPTA